MDVAKAQQKPFRVLSLDGGGMRGVYTAAFLDRLVKYFALSRNEPTLDFGKGFDLITGTSTGAIVACALAIGKPLSEVVDLYEKRGPDIFPHRIRTGVIRGKISVLYRVLRRRSFVKAGDGALRDALTAVLADTTMAQVYDKRGISLSVPAVAMKNHRAWVFKKTAKSGLRDDNYPLVDVCMATSAAPIYRIRWAVTVESRYLQTEGSGPTIRSLLA
jgi:uncharacterized protein